jgi:hypothetical protein
LAAQQFYLEGLPAGEAIREYLRTVGAGYPYGFYKIWRQYKKTTSYAAVRRYFWILKEIGLIESAGYSPSEHGFKKHLYRIVPGMEDDKRWQSPQAELYPDTGLGSKGYKKLEEKGLTPKGGRAKKYIK